MQVRVGEFPIGVCLTVLDVLQRLIDPHSLVVNP